MAIYIGNKQLSEFPSIGDTTVAEAYVGDTLVYESTKMFEVTYQIDTGNSVVVEVDDGADCIANAPTATKSGWTFLGWREDTTASSSVLPSKTADTEGIVLYAVFKQTITLSYNGNSATSGSTASQTADRYYNNGNSTNASFTLRANGYTRTNYSFAKWAQGSASGTQYSAGATVSLSANTTFYAYWVQTITNYGYTGGMQSFTAPVAGTYQLEVWGAQGGTVSDGAGGKGGYSKGNISLVSGQIIYICVGGVGANNTASSWNQVAGGYNGGAVGQGWNGNAGGGGGGATHIGKQNAVLRNTSVSNLIIAAGGGGGGYSGSAGNISGGAGGGTNGNQGAKSSTFTSNGYGTGGSQSAGGKCASSEVPFGTTLNHAGGYGYGGYVENNSSIGQSNGSGGGGGYYGGGGSYYWASAGGGSGYIGGVSAPKSMSNGQRSGNGYARVTFVSAS